MKNLIVLASLLLASEAYSKEFLVKLKEGHSLNMIHSEHVTKNVVLIKSENEFAKASLESLHEVEFVEENQTYTVQMGAPLPKAYEDLWGMTGAAGIEAEEAWKLTKGDKFLKIAVIDTGVDYTHKDLKSQMWTNTAELNGEPGVDDDGNGYVDDIHGYDFANNDGDPMDGNGHGTHCAGTIGAEHNKTGVRGVLGDVQIVAIKFLTDRGSGTTADAIKSIDYATQMKVQVMSNSWGGGGYSKLLEEAIQRANDAGIVFVAAAGNSSSDNDKKENYPSNYEVDNVIAVASHTKSDSLSYFSSYGKTMVDVSAPGSSILSTWKGGGYKSISGTSMATPHVSGIVGLMLARDKTLTPLEVREKLLLSCIEKGSYTDKVVCNGRVSALKAIK